MAKSHDQRAEPVEKPAPTSPLVPPNSAASASVKSALAAALARPLHVASGVVRKVDSVAQVVESGAQTAQELMKSFANSREIGRQRRLENLAKRNPDVRALLNSKK